MTPPLRDRLASVLSRDSAGGADEPAPTTPDETWPYEWTETGVETVQGEPVISHAAEDDEEDVFAGPLARQMIEGPRDNPDQPLYIGLGTRRGRHVGIERRFLFRHTCVFGVTGYGKTTLLKNAAKQVIESGHGCCFIDPKGQDSIELLQVIPDHRLDDIVWIEPGQARSAVAGFNFLEVGLDEDDPMYDTAVESVVDDLVQMVGLDDHWGPLMDGVCSNLIRGTTRLDRSFNLLDLYYLLISENARGQYAAMLEREGLTFLADYAHKIGQMEDDDLDALQRRFKDWVENPLARSTIAHRDTDIDMESIVENDSILIVRMAEQGKSLKKMVGTAILRRLWSAIRSRSATYQAEYDPFFLFADEFDLLARQDSAVTTMLSKARSLALSLFICCQQPSQLPGDVVDAMHANCDTTISFSPGSMKDSRAVARNLDMDPETLRHESNYHVWTQLTLSETRERSEAFRTYCFPPYPPLRDVPETMHLLERTVREYGREPLTDEEMRRGLILGGDGADQDLMAGGWPGVSTEREQRAVVQAVYDTAVRAGDPEGYVSLSECRDAVTRRLSRLASTPDPEELADRLQSDGDLWRRAIQNVDDDLLDVTRNGEGGKVRAAAPRATILPVGTDQSSGGIDHALLMWDAYEPLTRAGLDLTISEASGDDPDGLAYPAPPDEQTAPELVDRLTGGDVARVEAEHSTGESKPALTAQHVLQAAEEGRRAIVLTSPDIAQNVADTLYADPAYCRGRRDGGDWFYNSSRKVRVGGETMTRPGGGDSVWVREDSGDVVLRDTNGGEHARFDSIDAIDTDADAYPTGGGLDVRRPLAPELFAPEGDDLPHAEIVAVPEPPEDDTLGLDELTLRVDAEGLTVAASDVGEDTAPDPDDLDVPSGAADLLRALHDDGRATLTQADIVTLANETATVPDRSDRTVRNWVDALTDVDALTPTGETRNRSEILRVCGN